MGLLNELHRLAQRAKVSYQVHHEAGSPAITVSIDSINPSECYRGEMEVHPATALEKAIAFLQNILLKALYPALPPSSQRKPDRLR